MTVTPKQRAINKANSEITKDISLLIDMAKSCGLGELLYYLHYLHFTRLTHELGNPPENEKEILKIYSRRLDDAFKFLVQILGKHGKAEFVKEDTTDLLISSELVQIMNKYAVEINTKFESVSFIGTFKTVEISGERDQHARVKLSELKEEYLSKFINYNIRADQERSIEKTPLLLEDFFNHFKREYEPYSDLFLKEFKVSIDKFVEIAKWIIETINKNILSKEKEFPVTDAGKINVQDYKSIMLYGLSLIIEKKDIYLQFGDDVKYILQRLIFKTATYNEYELKFNIIDRQPIIEIDDVFIISPELLLDSFWANSHYSLLEAGTIKDEYKKRYAKNFVEKILLKAQEHNYKEFARDFELYEGKNTIGDIDLILKNDKNQFLLIEAKNHTIPMDVYIHDFNATKNRLQTLQNEWGKKVSRRLLHLEKHHEKYGISKDFKYMIVSKSPEIISHFSKSLILSLREFGIWLAAKDLEKPFANLYQELYQIKNTMTKEQLNSIVKDFASQWSFAKE